MEEYHITPETADKKANEIMDTKERGLSYNREKHLKDLRTNIKGDYLYSLDTPTDEVGDVLQGVLYGHEIEISQNSRGEFFGTMDGRKIPNEKAKAIVDKWKVKAMSKPDEDIRIKEAKKLRLEEDEIVNFNDTLDKILA